MFDLSDVPGKDEAIEATENVRLELSALSKMQGWNMQDWKISAPCYRGGKCGTKRLWKAETFCTFWYKICKSFLTQLRDSVVSSLGDGVTSPAPERAEYRLL